MEYTICSDTLKKHSTTMRKVCFYDWMIHKNRKRYSCAERLIMNV